MFFLCSSPRHSRPPSLCPLLSARSLASLDMLSKNDVVLLYATGTSVSAAGSRPDALPVGVSVTGEPTTASFTRSCLLNFAFDEAKSKSASGTSTFAGRGPRARPPRVFGPVRVAFTRISLTLLVRLSIALPPAGWPAVGDSNLAIATATAALAACVASRRAATVAAAEFGWSLGPLALPACPGGNVLAVRATGKGTAGKIWVGREPFGPVGTDLPVSGAVVDGPPEASDAAVALTSAAVGFDSTGGGGAFAKPCWPVA